MRQLGLCVIGATAFALASSCAWTPRQREAFALEIGRSLAVATAARVICDRIETHRVIQGGYFDVPKRACRHQQAPGGNLVFTFSGTGHFAKFGGFASGDFQQEVLVEYQVRLVGGYVYVVPERVEVYRPRVYNLSLLAGLGELVGMVSDGVRVVMDVNMNKPRTIILSLQGRLCVVEGWIPVGAIPTRCNGQSADDSFLPAGGSYEALARAPAGWDASGFSVTEALAPEFSSGVPTAASDGSPAPVAASNEPRPAQPSTPPESPPTSVETNPLVEQILNAPAETNPLVEQILNSAKVDTPRRGPLVRPAPVAPPLEPRPIAPQVADSRPAQPALTRSLVWDRSEDPSVLEFVTKKGRTLAEGVRFIALPAAKSAGLLSFEVRGDGDLTAVELEVEWSGRVVGSAYRTTVIWEFSRERHVRLVVVSDTSGTPIPDSSVTELDTYFRDAIFPSLRSSRNP